MQWVICRIEPGLPKTMVGGPYWTLENAQDSVEFISERDLAENQHINRLDVFYRVDQKG